MPQKPRKPIYYRTKFYNPRNSKTMILYIKQGGIIEDRLIKSLIEKKRKKQKANPISSIIFLIGRLTNYILDVKKTKAPVRIPRPMPLSMK